MKINKKQKLYVIPCRYGFTCIGFPVVKNQTIKIASFFSRQDLIDRAMKTGTKDAYKAYQDAISLAHDHYNKTGLQITTELHPQLIGYEGKRVEVMELDGSTRRFKVGKSTGYIPCHIELYNSRSLGGIAVTSNKFKSIRVIKE